MKQIGFIFISAIMIFIFWPILYSEYEEHTVLGMNHDQVWEEALVLKNHIPQHKVLIGLGHGPIVTTNVRAKDVITISMHGGSALIEIHGWHPKFKNLTNFKNGQKIRLKHRGSYIKTFEII